MWRWTAALALAAVWGVAPPTSADEASESSMTGMSVEGRSKAIDPALRARLVARLRDALAAGGTPPLSGASRALPTGGEAMTLGADHAALLVAYVAKDGTLQTRCVHGAPDAATVLAEAQHGDEALASPQHAPSATNAEAP